MSLSIGDVAARSGVSHHTLRYYERNGLLPAARRDASNRRLYDEQHLDQLAVVTTLRSLGFSLADVQGVLNVKSEHNTARSRVDAMRAAIGTLERSLDEKASALQRAREQLSQWRDELDSGEPWPDEPLRT